jgi:hypothetical protein
MRILTVARCGQMFGDVLSAESRLHLHEAADDTRPYCENNGEGVMILSSDDEASMMSSRILSGLLNAKAEVIVNLWSGDSRSNFRHVFRAVRSKERLCDVLILIAPGESARDFARFYQIKSRIRRVSPVRIMYEDMAA